MIHRLLIILKVVGLFCVAEISCALTLVELVVAPLEYLFFGPEKVLFCWKIFTWTAIELGSIEY